MKNYLNNKKDQLSFLRKAAKSRGLTFNPVSVSYNGNQAYALFSRATGEIVSSDNTIDGWYEMEMHQSAISGCKAN